VLTHVGSIPGLPSPSNRIYYCKEATCTLYSVGWFLQHDYKFLYPKINGRIHQEVYLPNGHLLSNTVLGKNFIFKLPSHLLHQNLQLSPTLSLFTGGFVAVVTFDPTDEHQFTKPQRLNIQIAKTIHLNYAHLPEERFLTVIDNHCLSHVPITRQDVINFFLTKKCTCLSTRMKMPPNPPSTNPITQLPGDQVTVDVNKLPCNSYGGHTQEITSYDRYSTKGHIVGSLNKTSKALTKSLLHIKSFYIPPKYDLKLFLSDSEATFEGCQKSINNSGTYFHYSPPLEHCKTNERFQQTLGEIITSLLDLLPYHLPPKFTINVKQHAIHIHNSLPNSITINRSPDQIFDGKIRDLNPNFPHLPFGAVCSVKSNPLTMARRATLYNTDIKYISPSEVGVNLGWDDAHPFCNVFLLANGLIIFRKTFTPLHDSVIPFGWVAKTMDTVTITATPDTEQLISDPTTDPILDQPIVTSPPPTPLLSSNHDLLNNTTTTASPTIPSIIPSFNPPVNTLPETWTTVTSPKQSTKPPVISNYSTRSKPLLKSFLSPSSTTTDAELKDTDFYLYPPAIKKEELTHRQAMSHPAAANCSTALDIEISGLIDILNALGPKPTPFDEIEEDAAIIPNKIFYKYKPSLPHQWKCRFVLGGDRQPIDTYVETFAGMTDTGISLLIIALCQAHSIEYDYTLHVSGFDITMAFPKVKATPHNCPRPLYTQLASYLPHPLAGQYLRVNGLVYGSKQANHEFDLEETKVILSAGFLAIDGDPHVFIRRDPTDPTNYCIVSIHVDDGRPVYSEKGTQFYNELIIAHEARWGKLTIQDPLIDYLAQEYSYGSNKSISISMEKYIEKLLIKSGVVDLPDADTPCTNDLFSPTSDPTPVPIKQYQSVVGGLIYLLPIRHDIRLPVGHLARANLKPTRGDFIKVIRVLRYLQATKHFALTFHSTSGYQLSFSADASHACHTNGRSQEAYGINCGNNPAPVVAYSSINNDSITVSPMESEYVVLSKAARKFIYFFTVSNQLGFRQHFPLSFFSDNAPSLGLTESPDVSKRSRHVNNIYHFIRELVRQHILKGTHVDNLHNHINLLTKPLQGKQFRFERDNLLNVAARLLIPNPKEPILAVVGKLLFTFLQDQQEI
jgi:hypothetical protein